MPGMKPFLSRKRKKKKNHHHVDVHINQEGVIWHFFRFFGHPSEDSFFLSLFGFRGFFFFLCFFTMQSCFFSVC